MLSLELQPLARHVSWLARSLGWLYAAAFVVALGSSLFGYAPVVLDAMPKLGASLLIASWLSYLAFLGLPATLLLLVSRYVLKGR